MKQYVITKLNKVAKNDVCCFLKDIDFGFDNPMNMMDLINQIKDLEKKMVEENKKLLECIKQLRNENSHLRNTIFELKQEINEKGEIL